MPEDHTDPDEDFISTKELLEDYGIRYATFLSWVTDKGLNNRIHRQKMDGIPGPPKVFIPRSLVEEYLEKKGKPRGRPKAIPSTSTQRRIGPLSKSPSPSDLTSEVTLTNIPLEQLNDVNHIQIFLIALNRLPVFDPRWPDYIRDIWFTCYKSLLEIVRGEG